MFLIGPFWVGSHMGEKRLGSRVPLSTLIAVMLLPLRMLMVDRVKLLREKKADLCQ